MLTLLHTSLIEEDKTSLRVKCNKKLCIIEQLALQSHLDFYVCLSLFGILNISPQSSKRGFALFYVQCDYSNQVTRWQTSQFAVLLSDKKKVTCSAVSMLISCVAQDSIIY